MSICVLIIDFVVFFAIKFNGLIIVNFFKNFNLVIVLWLVYIWNEKC